MAEHFVGQAAGEQAFARLIPVERQHLPKTQCLLWVVEKSALTQLQFPRLAIQHRDATEGELFLAEIEMSQANVAVDHPA
ncbi:hypothetical protein D3C73_912310 [compost metagenome]